MDILILIMIYFNSNKEFTPEINKINKAISIVESGNNPKAIGDKKYTYNYSVGINQIRIKTGKWLINHIIPDGLLKRLLQAKLKRQGINKVLLNKDINQYLSKHFFKWLYGIHRKNTKEAIISYNTGHNASKRIRNTSGLRYYKKIKREMKKLSN